MAAKSEGHSGRRVALGANQYAIGTDALAYPWAQTLWYTFPPFALIQATLDRVHTERHTMILVDPPLAYLDIVLRTDLPLACPHGPAVPGEGQSVTSITCTVESDLLVPERERLLSRGLSSPMVETIQSARAQVSVFPEMVSVHIMVGRTRPRPTHMPFRGHSIFPSTYVQVWLCLLDT